MSVTLKALAPKEHQLVIDLVRQAGVDVSDWSNFQGGDGKAASNPKYCYRWSFIEPTKVVVLNLWHGEFQERDGIIFRDINMRRIAREQGELGNSIRKRRAQDMDVAMQQAFHQSLPVRVIVCDRELGSLEDEASKSTKVSKRLLDTEAWAITAYDLKSGQATITRGVSPSRFVDQFDAQSDQVNQPEKRMREGEVYVRDPAIREAVRNRAEGRCEWCGEEGFKMSDGKIYIETHHVIPLSEGGEDSVANVVALCPNHHREAHFGREGARMREKLLSNSDLAKWKESQ